MNDQKEGAIVREKLTENKTSLKREQRHEEQNW